MAHIIIKIDQLIGAPGDGTIQISGTALMADSNTANWTVSVAASALAASWNEAIKDAAMTAVNAAYGPGTVQLLDKKTLLGGAVGL